MVIETTSKLYHIVCSIEFSPYSTSVLLVININKDFASEILDMIISVRVTYPRYPRSTSTYVYNLDEFILKMSLPNIWTSFLENKRILTRGN